MESQKLFESRSSMPGDSTLKTGLGRAYKYYNEILKISQGYLTEWKYYSSGGWLLKVYDRKKALYYLIPMKGAIDINLTIRENERDEFLKDSNFSHIRDELQSAKKYPEGYALHFTIKTKADFELAKSFLERLIELRK